jgi:anti-sigma regulatory factor (Ser/Thr protein kinase)/anti-anti-sigma regulatory factor
VAPPADLDLVLPAELSSLRASRAELAAWLDRAGAAEHDIFLLQHALGELLTNAIEHAFGGELGQAAVEVHATLTRAGCVEARVTDHGRWREPARRSTRGRGLALSAQLVESLRVEHTDSGTVATVRHTLTRPALMLTGELPAREPAGPAGDGRLVLSELPGDDETRVRVDGPVDATSATNLQQELLRRSRGGTMPMTVDLSGVTHLASAGVSALHQVADRHRRQAAPLTLYAAPGTTAELVLGLVSLPSAAPESLAPTDR